MHHADVILHPTMNYFLPMLLSCCTLHTPCAIATTFQSQTMANGAVKGRVMKCEVVGEVFRVKGLYRVVGAADGVSWVIDRWGGEWS